MRQAEARSRRADSFGDIEEWMARRWADLERLGPEAEAAGREAWDWANRTGRAVMAARPRDVELLGDKFRRGRTTPAEPARVVLTEPEPLDEARAVEAGARPDASVPQPVDLGLRFAVARPGDSVSKLVGSSEPGAIGKFFSLNGMDGRDSTLRSGRSYVVPTRWDDATGNEVRTGAALLGADNARLRMLAERRTDATKQAELFDQHRNIWTGESVDAELRPRIQPFQPLNARRSRFDDNSMAKTAVGTLGWGLGLAPGVVRGGVNTVKGSAEGAYFLSRLTNPFDPLLSPRGESANEQLFNAGQRFGGYVARGLNDPSMVGKDIAAAFQDFRLKQDPFATPAATTLGGEFSRAFNIGMNNGELAFDTGSLLLGGEFLRGAAGVGAAAKAADAAELAFLAKNPGIAARFDEPYRGMSHHIVPRRAELPAWLGGGPYPEWFIESDFNKIRYKDMTTRDVYRNHVGVDPRYSGGKVGADYGGARWSAENDLGWTRYGPMDRLNYGTSPYTKAVVGPVLFGGTATDLIELEPRP